MKYTTKAILEPVKFISGVVIFKKISATCSNDLNVDCNRSQVVRPLTIFMMYNFLINTVLQRTESSLPLTTIGRIRQSIVTIFCKFGKHTEKNLGTVHVSR